MGGKKETGERDRERGYTLSRALTRLTAARDLFLFGDDLDAQLRRHFAMDLDRHLHFADRLDRIRQLDLPLVDGEPFGLERVRDVARRDRAVHRVVLADAPGDLDLERLEPLAVGIGGGPLLRVLDLAALPLTL